MQLVERHIIKYNNPYYTELDKICFLTKNLYNAGLYTTRQYYFNNKKFLNFCNLNALFIKERNVDYYKLPTKVSNATLKFIEQNFKSFFALLKKCSKAKIPKYLNKNGRFIAVYTNQAISSKLFKKGIVKLSGTNIEIKTKVSNVQQVRIIPKNRHFIIEIVYKNDDCKIKENNNRYCSIDLGINNLATVGSNVIKPFIINGRPLKAINQYYNKTVAYLQSKLKNSYVSNKIYAITLKRNNKINDYLHKSSRYIINHLVSNNINTLVIGYNKEWKQEINIGKVNNQKFVFIPYSKFINMLAYKCKLVGISFILNEESYTSKCSFLDNEDVKKHETYLGKRIKRGLFKSASGKLINADLNGSLNILKKVVGEFKYPIEVCSTPAVYTVKFI